MTNLTALVPALDLQGEVRVLLLQAGRHEQRPIAPGEQSNPRPHDGKCGCRAQRQRGIRCALRSPVTAKEKTWKF